MFIVAGLGNPEAGYAKNRHNFGFMCIDALAQEYGFSDFKNKFDGLYADGKIGGEKVLLLKPLTFMNLSGNSVSKISSFYKVPPENIIVIHDDMDIEFGKLKAKVGGSPAGHNGIKSIDSHLGRNYTRLRLGIGRPPHKGEVTNFVLSDFSKAEKEELPYLFKDICSAFPLLLSDGVSAFSNKFALLRGNKNGL